MTGRLVTEIQTVRSLKELAVQIDDTIAFYLSLKEEYSQLLGGFLRDAEEKYGEEDWFKQLSMDKLGKAGGKQKKKKGEKKKKGKAVEPEGWIPFKSMYLSSSVQGEAEVMFEVIEAIESKLVELEEVKESIEDLRDVGLGNEVEYVCYLIDGVVKKIVIKPTDYTEVDKFTFNMGFTAIKALQTLRYT